MSGRDLAEAMCRMVHDGASAAVEWREERRRRLYFFVGGELVLAQSNLRSESAERVGERNPDLAPEAVQEHVVACRVQDGIRERGGDVFVHPDAPAPGMEPADIVALLWGVADVLPALPDTVHPRLTPKGARLLTRLPVDADVARYLMELDGTRPVEDVVAFGPAEPELLGRALALGAALGALERSGAEVLTRVLADHRHTSPGASLVGTLPNAGTLPPANVVSVPTAPPASASSNPATNGAAAATTRAAAPPSPDAGAPPDDDPFTTSAFAGDDIAGLIRGELERGPAEPKAPPRPAGPPAPPTPSTAPPTAPPAASPAATTPPAWSTTASPFAEDDGPLFGGASATVTLGSRGISAAAPPAASTTAADAPTAPDPFETRFGPTLGRIRGATDHFAVLGTTWQDTPAVHRRAYIALAQRLHPDRFSGESAEMNTVAAELFDRVHSAWEILGDDDRREAYIARVVRGEKSEEERAMDKVRSILDAEADFKRGVAELTAGRLPIAHEYIHRAATAVPEEVEFSAYAGYTTFRLNQGRDEAAATAGAKRLQAALQANDKLDGAWVLLGTVHRLQGNEAAARQAFVAALKLRPSNPDAVREMRRLGREKDTTAPPGGSFLSRLFGKKS
jgi:hypothetical protein